MTDSEAPPARGGGGPQWLRGPQRTTPEVSASPATVTGVGPAKPTYVDGVLGATPGSSNELFANRYAWGGVTPLPYALAAFVAMAAAWWAYDWAAWEPGAPDPVRSSDWMTNVYAVLLPSEGGRIGAYSQTRMWISIALLILAAGVIAVWIGRIGTNLRTGDGPFGSILPVMAFPAWWVLPITISVASEGRLDNSEVMIRFLVAFGILVSQFLLLRWPTLNRIWRAGRLRFDVVSVVLWLPMFIPWAMYFLSTAYTALVIGDDGVLDDSAWRPTEAMLDWARWTTRASGLLILLLLVVVSVVQHVQMRADVAADQARRAR